MLNYIKKKIRSSPSLRRAIKGFLLNFKFLIYRWKWMALSKKSEIKLELGSGSKKGLNGWTTVDMNGGSDISWDLKKGIPLQDNNVKTIYSSHLLEHIPFHELIIFLKECRRVMIAGGEFSVCVPNFRCYVDAYVNNKFFLEKDRCWPPAIIDTGSKIDQLNYMAYMTDEHKYMFDEENLINTLYKAGFANVKLRDFDESLDSLDRDFESIYALATK
ncbi:methyltransferase domain-containing protein [Candidatus Pelagibacter ubique]|nr:methyltransferase domain-containing protein [Candidatus Pelagibacter ubique]